MASLKSFLPILSRHTGLSVTALYERQRALVRLGLLPAPTKTGRNSGGAMATPGNVGVMVLSVLVTDRLSEMDERILDFLMLRAYPYTIYGNHRPGHCPLTGERTLYRALQSILSQKTFASMAEISVDRRRRLVHLWDVDRYGEESCTFGKDSGEGWQIQHLVEFGGLFPLSCELDAILNPDHVVSHDRPEPATKD